MCRDFSAMARSQSCHGGAGESASRAATGGCTPWRHALTLRMGTGWIGVRPV